MKQNILIIIGAALVTSLSSCGGFEAGGNNPGIEYAPDMYYSKGYEPMTQFSDSTKYRYNPYGMTMREPVKGSIAIGQMDYQYAFDNTAEGYEAAGASLQMPTDLTLKEQLEGERLYGIYCAVCHGDKGGNDGTVSSKQSSLKPSWANYQDNYVKALPAGKIYHTLTYGKNNMGSYASAVTPRDRWAIISYVKRLSMMDTLGNIPPAFAVEVKAPAAATETVDTAAAKKTSLSHTSTKTNKH